MQSRVLEITRTVLAELDVDRVLTVALDGLVDLCGAERGMLLLFDGGGALLFEKARNLERRDIEHPEFEISRTIIDRVRLDGQPYFDPDLLAQPAGALSDSVLRLNLISVICLPLVHDGPPDQSREVFGVVYVDTGNRRRAFTQDTLAVVTTFSDFISLAAYNALERHRLRNRVGLLEQELRERYRFDAIVGRDPKMVEVLKLVSRVAPSDATVTIEGESGTGKELVARAIHYNSHRRELPFVPINCGALPESLQEAELFGYERGAFTGAVKTQAGWFERADGGTLFLDEVGEMPLSLQVKFLRVLETGEYARLGSATIRRVDVRVVAATNRDLDELVASGQMRSDLHYRLAVVRLKLPSLRERRSDIPVLVRHFLERLKGGPVGRDLKISSEAEATLAAYPFPGNVRELWNVLQRAALMAEGPVIEALHLPETVRLPARRVAAPTGTFADAKRRVVEDFERGYLTRCLEESQGNISRAALAAGMDVKNFHQKMTRLAIDPLDYKPRRKA